jgi:hypothetical protein
MSLENPKEIIQIIQSSVESGKLQQGKELIRAYRAGLIPSEVLKQFGGLIESWGDNLLASGRVDAALIKFELALGIFSKAIGTSGSGDICEGKDMLERLGRKIKSTKV